MAGRIYLDGLWVSQGQPRLVNETLTDPPAAGAVKQFVAGQIGKEVTLPEPTNSGDLYPVTYKYARRYASDAAQNAPYAFQQWQDSDNFVFQQGTATGVPAGVAFMDDNNASVPDRGVQVGNFGFILVQGETLVQCAAGVAAGDALMMIAAGVVDTATAGKPVVGIAKEAVGATLANHVTAIIDVPRAQR
jgi:hypothetical protein